VTALWLGSFTTPTIPPKVDWPKVHGADNKIAINSIDTFPNVIARPPWCLAREQRAPGSE
jgi:hypothetical protein